MLISFYTRKVHSAHELSCVVSAAPSQDFTLALLCSNWSTCHMNKNIDIPEKERALVLQGGGSLGAYEAGAYRALYESLSGKDNSEGRKGRSTFDIVAGTSIGAINAAVL